MRLSTFSRINTINECLSLSNVFNLRSLKILLKSIITMHATFNNQCVTNNNTTKVSVREFGFDFFELQRERSSQLSFTLVNTTNSIHRRVVYSV